MSAVADFFAALPARAAGHPEKTRGLHDTYLFDVGPAGSWTVTVDDGTVSVAEGDTGAATCTIVTNEAPSSASRAAARTRRWPS